jgi:hypothetical protein
MLRKIQVFMGVTIVSVERSAYIIRLKRISKQGTTLSVTSDRFLRNVVSYKSHTASHPRRRHSSVGRLLIHCKQRP